MNDDKLLDLLLQWEERHDQGRDVTAEELCRDCPDLIGPLKTRIQALQKTAWMKRPLDKVPPDPPDDAPPRTLADRYRLDKLAGEGGFGQVWKAFDLELQRPVAVKLPKPSRKFSEEEIERFVAEARKVARLRHPGIVAVHDIHRSGGAYFFVTDWIEGSDLAQRLRQGPLPQPDAVQLVAEVARTLAHAHCQGFVHRDIKPANILLDGQGKPLVCDFGIAATEQELLHEPQRLLATLAYGSPEQIIGQPVDARTDIYGLGVVLFELLAGRLPFDDPDPATLREQVLSQPAPPLRSLNLAIPKDLERIVSKCLVKNPADRHPSAQALANALDACLTPRKARKLGVLAGSVGVVLLGIAAVLGWNGFLSQRPPVDGNNDQPEIVTNGQPIPLKNPPLLTDLAVATWAIQKGGRVTLHPKPGVPHKVYRAVGELPQGEISIQHLDFSGAKKLTDADLHSVRVLAALTELTLDRTPITNAGLENLRGLMSLEIVRLDGTKITDKGFQTVAQLPRLHMLSLANTEVELPDGQSVDGLRKLRWLALGGTKVTDASLGHFGKLFALEELRLSHTAITDEGMKHLAGLTRMQTLDISQTRVTDEGLRHINGMKSLRWLAAAGNSLGDAALEHCEGLTQLKMLHLSNTQISDKGLQRLEKLTGLEELQLSGTQVTEEGVQRFKAALPGCVVRR